MECPPPCIYSSQGTPAQLKLTLPWTSLVVQWLKVCLPIQGAQVWSRAPGRLHTGSWATTAEPMHPGACTWQQETSHCYEQTQSRQKIYYFFLFIFLKFTYLFINYFTLQYCIGFAIHWHESTTGVHEFPILNHPPPHPNLSPHIIFLGHPSAPAPSILCPVSNLDWHFLKKLFYTRV